MVIRDFIKSKNMYSLDLTSAVNSWKVIGKLEKDLLKSKLIIYPKKSSIDTIEKLFVGEYI